MIYAGIEFYNVEQITENGQLLRFEESLIKSLGYKSHQRGRFYGYRAIGCELRFKTPARFFDLTLQSVKEDCHVYIFFGDYMFKSFVLKEGVESCLHIEIPDRFYNLFDSLPKRMYSPNLIRCVIGYPGYVRFKGLNTFGNSVTPPDINDIPNKRLMIYGSSISHGSESLEYINSYAFILSRMLGIDIINKSIPGSCLAEKQMIDYLSTISVDSTFIEFGVNVLQLYDLQEYKNRVSYILEKIKTPLYLTGVLANGVLIEKDEPRYLRFNEFNEFLKTIKGVNIIDPSDVLTDFSALTFDLLHPSDYGQLLIALKLKDKIVI